MMASSRRQPTLHIFQDPVISFDHSGIARQPSQGPARALEFVSNNPLAKKNVVFNWPVTGPSGPSPRKPVRQLNSLPRAVFSEKFNVSFPPPHQAVFITDSPRKKPAYSTFPPIAPQKPQKALFTTFPSIRPADKENFNPAIHNDNFAEFPDPSYGYKAPLKRTLQEPTTLEDRQFKKLKPEQPAAIHIPEPEDMPIVEDDGSKPPYSYAALIGMSILRAPNRRLTLASIYKWISDSFKYYRVSDVGWQNSIRHNLSLNKAFVKRERPKNDPGKGSYWAIEPGSESLFVFVKDKPSRRPPSSTGPIMTGAGVKRETSHSFGSNSSTAYHAPKKSVVISENRALEILEPSSDATIPASDPACQDQEAENNIQSRTPSSQCLHASPLQPIHSSPPVSHCSAVHEGTPPVTSHMSSSSCHSHSRKRKLAATNDSGYLSSVDSSGLRQYAAVNMPTSGIGLERPRIKPGRAEEEIAKIRGSSRDTSPRKGRVSSKPRMITSSPLRDLDSSSILPPLTPGITFKMPPKPPASVSPNTNLRNHRNRIRELVGSPPKNLGLLHEDTPWISAFHTIDDEEPNFFNDSFHTDFTVFDDNNENAPFGPAYGSPEKRPSKRPRLDRANTTGNILGDITGTSNNNSHVAPALKAPALNSHLRQKSPSKSPVFGAAVFGMPQDDLFGVDLFTDEDPANYFGGVDILQGFQKIGGKQQKNG
ncbi:MAG: hypothetical protein M1830_003367 [Pleopsidium flavum]|nr:MAG: hypothetical protein M1830_003367 [Pleopsidium flavum]